MQVLGELGALAGAAPWGARASLQHQQLLPLRPHGLAPVRHFFGGLTAAEPSKTTMSGGCSEQLYDVVSCVDQYSKFVPWCARSTVLVDRPRPEGGYLEAELEVGFQVFNERYTSKVTLQRPHRVHSSVDDSSLFDHLESTWVMRPGPAPGTTWLVFKVDFAFRSALYRHVADLFFDQVVKRMMGAFEGRCAQLYGPSSLAGSGRRRVMGAGGGSGGSPSAAQQQLQQQVQQRAHHDHLPHYQQRQYIQQQQQIQPGDRFEPRASAAEQEDPSQPQQQHTGTLIEAPPGSRGGSRP